MPETTLLPDVEAPRIPPPLTDPSRHRRVLALGLVLSVSFTHFIFSAFYYLFHAEGVLNGRRTQFSLIAALIAEVTSLFVLWFVLSERKGSWKEIGWNPQWMDILRGIGLVVLSSAAARIISDCFQVSYRSYAGHYLQPKSVHGVIGVGIS